MKKTGFQKSEQVLKDPLRFYWENLWLSKLVLSWHPRWKKVCEWTNASSKEFEKWQGISDISDV